MSEEFAHNDHISCAYSAKAESILITGRETNGYLNYTGRRANDNLEIVPQILREHNRPQTPLKGAYRP